MRLAGLLGVALHGLFRRFARATSSGIGSPFAFVAAVVIIIVWAASGPLFGFSETWQLVINTGTTIITFLVVFMIQNTQNRDSQAVHLKLDEIIRVLKHARNEMIDVEDKDDEILKRYQEEFRKLEDVIDPSYKHRVGEPAKPAPSRHAHGRGSSS